jgi:hypothetical protein
VIKKPQRRRPRPDLGCRTMDGYMKEVSSIVDKIVCNMLMKRMAKKERKLKLA